MNLHNAVKDRLTTPDVSIPAGTIVRTQEVTEVRPCTLTFQVSVQDPVYKTVDIEARIYLRQGYDPIAVRERIKTRLEEWFQISNPDGTSNANIDFGFNIKDGDGNPVGEVALSDVFNVIRDTDGVRKIGDRHGDLKLNGLPADVKLRIQELPVFLLKHSTRCPISGSAWRAYQRFAEEEPNAELWKVLVIENAQLSSEISRETGIRHQSPQILLFHKGDVVWNDSHYSIKEDGLRKALDDVPAS